MKTRTFTIIYDRVVGKKGTKHYTFGKLNGSIFGGFYIRKDVDVPDRIALVFKEGEEE